MRPADAGMMADADHTRNSVCVFDDDTPDHGIGFDMTAGGHGLANGEVHEVVKVARHITLVYQLLVLQETSLHR